MTAAATDMGRTSFKVSEHVADSVSAPSVPEKIFAGPAGGKRAAARHSNGCSIFPGLATSVRATRVAVFPLANPDGSPDTEISPLRDSGEASFARLAPLPGFDPSLRGALSPGNEGGGGKRPNVWAQVRRRDRAAGQAVAPTHQNPLAGRSGRYQERGKNYGPTNMTRDFAEFFQVSGRRCQKTFSKQLRLNLAEEDSRLSKRYTENAEAFQLYLRGTPLVRIADGGRIQERALNTSKNAIQTDPGFALAHAELAAVLYLPGVLWYGSSSSEFSPRHGHRAERALDLDDKLAEAHEVSGHARPFRLALGRRGAGIQTLSRN